MGKTSKRWLITISCWAALVGLLGFIKFSQISAAIAFGASFPEPSETVITGVAEQARYVPHTRVVAEVVPMRLVTISNELAGTIVDVGFAPGDEVAAGQMLISQDVSEERAMLAAANARQAVAQRTLDRSESLVGGSAISQQAVDDAIAERDSAQADAARILAMMAKKVLRAPFAARAGLERWEVGGYLPAASAVTTLVGKGSRVWIAFSLPQQQARLAVGDPVTVNTRSGVAVPAAVVARAPQVDPTTRSVRYRAELESQELAALPGALISVAVATGDPVPALRVPALAVREDTFGQHVFTLVAAEAGADGPYRAQRRAVSVLRLDAEIAWLTDTPSTQLGAGEEVAVQGAFKLRDGILVRRETPPAADGQSQ